MRVSFPSFGAIEPPWRVSSATVTWWIGVLLYAIGGFVGFPEERFTQMNTIMPAAARR